MPKKKTARLRKPIARARRAAPRKLQTITLPETKKGEVFRGVLVDPKGKPLHHLVELETAPRSANWSAALEIAKKAGYTLPGFHSGALLRASDPRGQSGAFWLSEEYPGDDAYAYAQYFSYGIQNGCHKDNEFAVRLVRTIPI